MDLKIGPGVGVRHPETFEIGDGVFIGEQAIIQGRFDGTLRDRRQGLDRPTGFLDARDLVIGDHVGWGPGAEVLGSEHTGIPARPADYRHRPGIAPGALRRAADIGVNAVLLPGLPWAGGLSLARARWSRATPALRQGGRRAGLCHRPRDAPRRRPGPKPRRGR